MSGPVLAILITVLCHFVGMALLIGAMGREVFDVFRTRTSDDDWGGGPPPPDPEPVVPIAPTGGGLPLPDAVPADVRLREPGRIGRGRPERRPSHPPVEPQRVPGRATRS